MYTDEKTIYKSHEITAAPERGESPVYTKIRREFVAKYHKSAEEEEYYSNATAPSTSSSASSSLLSYSESSSLSANALTNSEKRIVAKEVEISYFTFTVEVYPAITVNVHFPNHIFDWKKG